MAMHLGEAQISPGTIGQEVRRLQEILVGGGYHLIIDGIYGPQTSEAIKSFQKSKGLLADGVVGPLTWDALNGRTSDIQPPGPQPIPVPQGPKPSSFSMPIVLAGLGLLAFGFLQTRAKR